MTGYLTTHGRPEKVRLPLPPQDAARAKTETEIYTRFIRHLHHVPNSCLDIKVLSSIQFTADMMDLSDAMVAKTLADLGLRAPRRALPEGYLEFVDRSLLRSGWEVGGPAGSSLEMKQHWDRIGEDKFAAVRRRNALRDEKLAVPV